MAEANQHLELKLTNALSTVAVIDHEVVAVVNNINSGMLGLLAYIQPPLMIRTHVLHSPSHPPIRHPSGRYSSPKIFVLMTMT